MTIGMNNEPGSGMPKQPRQAVYVPPGDGEKAPDPIGYPQREKAGSEVTAGAYALHEMSKPPGEGPPAHVHADMEEAFYILSGEFTFRVGTEEIVAPAGGFVLVPRGVLHGFWNSGKAEGHYLRLFSPAPARSTLAMWELLGKRVGEGRERKEGTTHELFIREVARLQSEGGPS